MFLAVSAIVLLFFTLAWFVLPGLETTAEIHVVHIPPTAPEEPASTKPKVSPTRKPTPPAASAQPPNRLITSQALSQVAIPTVDVSTAAESVDFSSGIDSFGETWAGDTGQAGDAGSGSAFGSTQQTSSALVGSLYDFKQNPRGGAIEFDPAKVNDFADKALDLQRAKYRESAFRKYFRAPQELYLSHVAIPYSDASNGPRFFGAEKEVQPTGWVANYQGKIRAPYDGTFRFVGIGDDYLTVFVNDRPRLFASWPSLQDAVKGSWDPSKEKSTHTGPFANLPLIYGDWIKMKKGDELNLNIALGERPGGKVGFVLLIEEKGRVHQTDSETGRPILPLFTTGPISQERRDEIEKDFGSFRFDWDNIPVFQ